MPEDDEDDDGLSHPETNPSDPMSEVSQQLQHIQDEQEQGEAATSAPPHGVIHNQSTESPFPGFPVAWVPSQDGSSSLPFDMLSATAPHTSSDVTFGVGFVLDEDSENDDMNHANSSQVDDQRNHALHEFLNRWAGSCAQSGRSASKKRKRGPNPIYLHKMRHEKPTETRRSDLLGDYCDFQGIDWTKLEVRRAEARIVRSQSYRNYTNLPPPAWHVSYVLQRLYSDI